MLKTRTDNQLYRLFLELHRLHQLDRDAASYKGSG